MRVGMIFPGQGSEVAGMGLALAARNTRAKRLLALASEATGVDVTRAIERGGRDLTRTEVLQPTLVAVSLAAAHAAVDAGAQIDIVLGHSLGELAAACFAHDLDDETAIALASARGRAMSMASTGRPGGMIAFATKLDLPEGVSLAAHNADDEWVVSGTNEALARLARSKGTKLPVSGAWHSPAMEPAVEPMRALLASALTGRTLRCTWLSAVTAALVGSIDEAVDALARGLVAPIRWVDTMSVLASMHPDVVALAPPGRVSRSLARRNLGRKIRLALIDSTDDLMAFARS